MIPVLVTDTGLHVAAWADLKMNALCSEVFDQARIFDTANSMTNPLRLQSAKRLPHAFSARRLSGVRCAPDSVFGGKPKGWDVRIERKGCLVSSQVKRYDTATSRKRNVRGRKGKTGRPSGMGGSEGGPPDGTDRL